MRHGEHQCAERGLHRPAVCQQQRAEGGKVHAGDDRAGREVAHHDERHDQLVRRKAEDERKQYHAVYPEHPRCRV